MVASDDTGTAEAVIAFLMHDGRILILRRSDETGAAGGRWAGISGELGQATLIQAYAALRRETGLEADNVELLQQGEPLHVYDPDNERTKRLHPFLFALTDRSRMRLDREHVQRRWVWPGEIDQLDTVPGLADALRRVYP